MNDKKKISQLDAVSRLYIDNILAVSKDLSGSPSTKKASLQNIVDLFGEGYFPKQVEDLELLSLENAASGYVRTVNDANNGGLFRAQEGGEVDGINVVASNTNGWTWRRISVVLEDSGVFFKYSQTTPDLIWSITHNLMRHPSVTIIDDSKNMVIADVVHIDRNSLQIRFSTEQTGNAYLI
jgi:hypothetical protein